MFTFQHGTYFQETFFISLKTMAQSSDTKILFTKNFASLLEGAFRKIFCVENTVCTYHKLFLTLPSQVLGQCYIGYHIVSLRFTRPIGLTLLPLNYLAGEGSILSVARHKLWLVCNVYVEWGEKVTDRDEINKFERCLQQDPDATNTWCYKHASYKLYLTKFYVPHSSVTILFTTFIP